MQFEAVDEGLARCYAPEADAGHAVHLKGQDDPVPVDGGRNLEPVGYPDGDLISLTQPQCRGRNGAVDGGRHTDHAGKVDRCFGDDQINRLAAQHGRGTGVCLVLQTAPCVQQGWKACQHTASHQPLYEVTACRTKRFHQCSNSAISFFITLPSITSTVAKCLLMILSFSSHARSDRPAIATGMPTAST